MARICLVDDDERVRDALSLGLGDAGFEVVAAEGGQEALDLLERESFSALVTDMKMPGFDGGKLITALRARHPDLPIIAVTGGGEIAGRDVAALAQASGANACLVKPFRTADIVAALERLIQARA